MEHDPDVYEARYGFSWKDFLAFLGCLAFVLVAILASSEDFPLWLRLLCGGFSGFGCVVLPARMMSRKLPLRVDWEGITLGSEFLRPSSGAVLVPWGEIEAVVLWAWGSKYAQIGYIGLDRRAGAPALPGGPDAMTRAMLTSGGIPRNLVESSRPINGWRLDVDRMLALIERYGEHVTVVDYR
ncbi:hypothetical protein Plo01_47850 [Planobispora longispora]|uniref:PH domain-containing protein n=2 Tax=Planobispora longispora TaxID=28887 RepID=A0A8J3RKT9_9ACTN|nr:hypothetical protein Plo01_47850 [Planobispora longispora]